MYATVQISVEQKKALAIPRNALLRLGEYKVVFVAGRRRRRRASGSSACPSTSTRARPSQWLEVKHGLEPGQKVVVSGAILLSQKL